MPGAGVLLAVTPTLVVLRALGLGDFLTAVPALRALADAFPGHRRLLAAPVPLAPLAALTGAVHDTVPVEPLTPLPPRLFGADIAVNLHGCGPQSHRVLLAARPRRLIAFAHPEVPESAPGPAWPSDVHEVARWCGLLQACGIPADPRRLDLEPPGGVTPPAIANGATLIHPGAASRARRWPPERWAAVARAEASAGRTVLVTAGPGEDPLVSAVLRLAGGGAAAPILPAGRTDLLQLTALVAVAGRVVCGDTGVAHLATAVRTPSVVLFGPTSPARWGPPPDRPIHRVLWAGTEGSPHGDELDPGLLRVGVGAVIDALSDLPDLDRPVVMAS
ncbi:MAG TPA: glycosyltransferase family 9 protein [Acidimicrobiia bacterium]|nr:glycosyltransferase family 9 protein [Acidimicrobiia bacterium]